MNNLSRQSRRRRATLAASLCAALLLPFVNFHSAVAQSQKAAASAQVVESGKFRLHKFEQAIGEESYEITRDKDSLLLRSNFEFTDRTTRVPLTASLRMRQDLTPEQFEIKGSTARTSTIDSAVVIKDGSASIRSGAETKQVAVPESFFTISGYAPISMQMMLVRYITTHDVRKPLPILPGGAVTVEKRGRDVVKIKDKELALDRYTVSGLIWGRESLWLDSSQQLIAAVTIDAEFDHLEAIREGYETALPTFVSRAAEDNMAALAELGNRISPQRKGALAITGATLIDGTGKPAVADAVVVVEGDRIVAAGPRAQVKIPKGASIIDARGKTVMPGLWDMHAHFEQVEWGPIYLAAGVTTVRDVGNEFEFITAVRDAVKSGRGLGPRMLLAGIVDGDSAGALGIIRANTPEEARAVVNRYKNAGFDQIKIYSSIKPDILAAITAEAHRLGLTVTGHVPNGMNAVQAVEAGMDQINHIQYLPAVLRPKDFRPQQGVAPPPIDMDSAEVKQTIQFFKEHGTVFDPTVALFELLWHPTDTPIKTFEPGVEKIASELAGPINNMGAPPKSATLLRSRLEQYFAIIGALHRAGIPIVAGTDQAVPGHSLHREIELYVKSGFTPMEAIQAATTVPARVMKLDKEVGTIEAGKRADLIILDANPLESISNIRKVRSVITGGRLYDTAQLWQSVGFKP
ncbi:MAG: hypothetical protein QOF02_1640 [Blastocatellia bacterium]|jgi:imidazolonepropionase-like amidohydrolase|nr:hypothetical protein [Blastocatellia bacterium]